MPEGTQKLIQGAQQAMSTGNWRGAETLLQEAVTTDPASLAAWLNLAAVRRQLNNMDGAFAALRSALRIDGRNFHALLMSGSLLEKLNMGTEAAEAYGAAIAQAPPENQLDGLTQQALKRARAVRAQYTTQVGNFIRDQIAGSSAKCTAVERRRIDAFIGTTLRVRERYQQDPSHYYYPGLPSIEFYERSEFPWIEEFETATAAAQEEFVKIAQEDTPGFTPYVNYPDHAPLDQWRELNRSPRWNSLQFFHRGRPIEENQRRAPRTMAAVSKLPQPYTYESSPAAMFSILQPKTRIPPHTGVSNFRLVVHLPLIVPPNCWFRVGGETREWRVGEAWVFDDTIEHEAANDSDQVRTILICDIWSPRLSPEERQVITEVMESQSKFTNVKPPENV